MKARFVRKCPIYSECSKITGSFFVKQVTRSEKPLVDTVVTPVIESAVNQEVMLQTTTLMYSIV